MERIGARHNLLITCDSMDRARAVIEKLERHGVGGVHISLSGVPARVAVAVTGTHERGGRAVRGVAGRLVRGGIAGMVVGALLGLLAGLIATGELTAYLGPFAVGGAIAGGTVGAVAAAAGLPLEGARRLPFGHGGPRLVVVGVHADDVDVVERACAAVSHGDVIAVERVGPDDARLQRARGA